jgi:penicillin-insensitive murein endopeptidase
MSEQCFGPPFASLRQAIPSRKLARLRSFVVFVGAVLLAGCAGAQRSDAVQRKPERPAPARVELAPLAVASNAIEPPKVRTLSPTITTAELSSKLKTSPASLASMSIGRPNHGSLFNAIQMPESPDWHVVEPENGWGTDESIASIVRAVSSVHELYQQTPPLYIGHLSSRRGGYLRPHRSHQSGRDADIGFYYSGGPGWYAPGSAKNLDLARTWALVKAFATDANVENIFIDRSVQRLLRDYALGAGESAEFLDALFESPKHRDRVIRHEWGHLTHLHVRFRCPIAEDAGARAAREIAAIDGVKPAATTTGRHALNRGRARSRS